MWVEGTLEGKYIRQSLKTSQWDAGERIIDGWKESGKVVSAASGWTIVESIQKYFEKAKSGVRRTEDNRSFLGKFELFCDKHNYTSVGEIDADCLGLFLDSNPVWSESLECRRRLKAFMNFLVRSKMMKTNPIKELERLKTKRRITDYVRRNELDLILAALASDQERPRLDYVGPAYAHAYVYLLRWSGLRAGDALRIGPSNFEKNIKGHTILRIIQSKTGLPLVVRVRDDLPVLLNSLELKGPTSYFMKPCRGLEGLNKKQAAKKEEKHIRNVVQTYDRRLKWAVKAAGVTRHIHLHMLRDTFAIELILAGRPIDYISKQLGHENVAMTIKHYLPWVEERKQMMDDTAPEYWY